MVAVGERVVLALGHQAQHGRLVDQLDPPVHQEPGLHVLHEQPPLQPVLADHRDRLEPHPAETAGHEHLRARVQPAQTGLRRVRLAVRAGPADVGHDQPDGIHGSHLAGPTVTGSRG
jgi:hypothetical protein